MQFIAHTTDPKTFAHKKGAVAAIKRDLNKHFDTHGDVLFDTGYDVKPAGDDRFGVVLYVDLTPAEAQEKVGPELEGYVIEPQLKEEPKVAEPKSDDKPANKPKRAKPMPKPEGEYTEEYVTSKSRNINIQPSGLPLIPGRHGSKQQLALDLLARDEGASLWELVVALRRNDGNLPKPETLTAGLYHHFPQKGYGISTTQDVNGVHRYHLVYPAGIDAVATPRRPEAQTKRIDAMRAILATDEGEFAAKVAALSDDDLIAKFKNLTVFKTYLEKGNDI